MRDGLARAGQSAMSPSPRDVFRTIDGDTFEARVALSRVSTDHARCDCAASMRPELHARCAEELRMREAAAGRAATHARRRRRHDLQHRAGQISRPRRSPTLRQWNRRTFRRRAARSRASYGGGHRRAGVRARSLKKSCAIARLLINLADQRVTTTGVPTATR